MAKSHQGKKASKKMAVKPAPKKATRKTAPKKAVAAPAAATFPGHWAPAAMPKIQGNNKKSATTKPKNRKTTTVEKGTLTTIHGKHPFTVTVDDKNEVELKVALQNFNPHTVSGVENLQNLKEQLISFLQQRPADQTTGRRKISELPRFTGDQLVVLNPDMDVSTLEKFAAKSSLKIASSRDYLSQPESALELAKMQGDGIVFHDLNVALINSQSQDKLVKLMNSNTGSGKFLSREPERWIYALNESSSVSPAAAYIDDKTASWGVHATNCIQSALTGKDIRLAILDTGYNSQHPNFRGKQVVSRSFIPESTTAEDDEGHGTMCAGIASGQYHDILKYRYGVASNIALYVGKVLDNQGKGREGNLITAVQWAVANQCKIISMSLGSSVKPDDQESVAFETVAASALKRGTLLIAAAGNESNRKYGYIAPVLYPANGPSVMAIGAVDASLQLYNDSCGGTADGGGQIDLVGPGVKIISAYLATQNYAVDSGTSMAAPFVAGLAALYWEQNPTASAAEIWLKLTQTAKRLNLSATDVGAGLASLR
ncbi:S8 family serine peptidase [Chitinophaga qingshengii]|uniref:S8 family serine peptidase n=1 Tax=Chitinophaga qingshengii TaxID=1569794 RepID=A0ABR7TMJ7_9BACT|nr:S8 family serine peptidase [Chitinophaga qingshengii]MBC9930279.1 S8 family serine peptidase [Chitinophaga qingshengii]